MYPNYSGIVCNDSNTIVPNEACCSSPEALCQRCAKQAGLSTRVAVRNVPSRDDEPLVMPVIDWQQEQPQGENQTQSVQHAADDMLIAPTLDFTNGERRRELGL